MGYFSKLIFKQFEKLNQEKYFILVLEIISGDKFK